MTWLTMSDAQEMGIEVSPFESSRDQPPSAEPREGDRKEAEPRPATVERPPSEPTLPNNEPQKIKTLSVRGDQPDGAAAPVTLAKTQDRLGLSSLPNQIAPVAQRAVLFDEDPADPKGKQFVGSVIWRTEQVKASAGQKADIAVRADVDIPDRKFKMTMSFRRNTDTSLPASHTAELTFILPQDFSGGGVGNAPGILMKSNEQAFGTPLAGLAVKVTDGFFLVGLSNVDADRTRNLQLLKERSWVDVPLVYNNQRRAIIAIEKGAPGERAFKDAFTAWGEEYPTATTVQPESATAATLSHSELDAMRARLASFWNVRPGVEHPEELYVTVRIRLNPDRRLAAPPVVVSTGSSPRYQKAADAAVRAVLQGQPYTMLRDETYEQWKYMDIDFDPTKFRTKLPRHPQRQRTKVIFRHPKTQNWTRS
jgi:hypothetical protein